MKIVFWISLLLSSFVLFAQDERVSLEENEQIVEEDQVDPQQQEPAKTTQKSDREVIRVECVCPQNNIQEEEAESAVNTLFPKDSVFIIAPESSFNSAPPEQQQESEPKERIPGYIEKLPNRYSDDTYKQIPME
jgi:hypothetical protein